MAQARITQRWADGTETDLEVYVEGEFPDAVDEARVQVTHLWRTTCVEAENEPQ